MENCIECGKEVDENEDDYFSYIKLQLAERDRIEKVQRVYCSSKCRSDWKWRNYYNFLEITT